MISRTEIKKCGWKPIENHKAKYKGYSLRLKGEDYVLYHKDEIEGNVVVCKIHDTPESMDHSVRTEETLFNGFLPARYELQILMRCLKIG